MIWAGFYAVNDDDCEAVFFEHGLCGIEGLAQAGKRFEEIVADQQDHRDLGLQQLLAKMTWLGFGIDNLAGVQAQIRELSEQDIYLTFIFSGVCEVEGLMAHDTVFGVVQDSSARS